MCALKKTLWHLAFCAPVGQPIIVHKFHSLFVLDAGGPDRFLPHFTSPSSPPIRETRVKVAAGLRLDARRRWRTRFKKAVSAALQRGRYLTAPNCSILEHEGGTLRERKQLTTLRTRQAATKALHLDSWFHAGRLWVRRKMTG